MLLSLRRELSRNKTLRVILISIVSIIAAIAVLLGAFLLTPSGQSSYRAVEIPELSTDLTYVEEPPVGQLDAPDAPHIQVDMLGQPVAPPNENETPEGAVPPPVEQQDNTNTNQLPEPAPGSVEERTRAMNQVSNIGIRFGIPSVGLDVPLGEMTVVDDVIEPTNFTSVFAVRNMGVPYTETHTGTTYLATHALDVRPDGNILSYSPGGLAPGNFFFDTETDTMRVNEGSEITIGDHRFAVTGSERIGKGVIAKEKELWDESIPNRLVILLCHPDSNDNHVVYARPI